MQYARWGSWEGDLDFSAWMGIAFFLLSIPMGVATNMLTPRFVAYLDKRKLIKSHRTKEQDIAAYRSIEAFKNGARDKYASYIGLAVLSHRLHYGRMHVFTGRRDRISNTKSRLLCPSRIARNAVERPHRPVLWAWLYMPDPDFYNGAAHRSLCRIHCGKFAKSGEERMRSNGLRRVERRSVIRLS